MICLDGSRTDANLKLAFSEAGRFDRLYLRHEQIAEAAGLPELAALSRAASDSGAHYASGHLDYLVADQSKAISSMTSAREFRTVMAAMIEEHTAMYAGMARAARDEDFEEIAGWFETLAKSGRSHVRRMRRAMRNSR
jgi:rubrerythrin